MLDGLEKYLGEDISTVDIRKMNVSDLECLFKVYEETVWSIINERWNGSSC